MKAESETARFASSGPAVSAARRRWCVGKTFFAVLTAGLLGACANLAAPGSGGDERAVESAIEYYHFVRKLGPAELERERDALAVGGSDPLNQLLQAIALARPPGSNVPRALALLEVVEASARPEAVALRPLARLLADQFAEQRRLETAARSLTRQLEHTGQHLKESRRHARQLEEKIEALTEIERTLPERPAAHAAPPPPPERRITR
ncbi:permease [Azoarcus sp. PA01]|nr:permease [Azoarcus sp. PA01]